MCQRTFLPLACADKKVCAACRLVFTALCNAALTTQVSAGSNVPGGKRPRTPVDAKARSDTQANFAVKEDVHRELSELFARTSSNPTFVAGLQVLFLHFDVWRCQSS